MSIRIRDKKQATELTTGLSEQFVRIPNPSYVYPPYEVCPVAPPLTAFTKPPLAAVMDMDGTTTTTETLCLHSLEFAVRKAMGPAGAEWSGLDSRRDYPNVIGNSTTKHVEYLVDAYGDRFDANALGKAFIDAAGWTLRNSRDEQRRRQVRINLKQAGLDERTLAGLSDATASEQKMASNPAITRRDLQIQACIDVYYQRYHEILAAIESGDRDFLERIPGVDAVRPLIEPMPGVAMTLALLSGGLGDEAGALVGLLPMPDGPDGPDDTQQTLAVLGRFFREHPVRLALVTSSIRYEAEVVMGEVLNVIREEVAGWPVSDDLKSRLNERFASPQRCYDAFVTASDSSEIRLKPFRDLYSIALQQAGIDPADFDAVIGFEDSQSGTVAIRAAGIGRCIALPFHETGGHDFEAASVVARGGLPEVLIRHRFFMDQLLDELR